MKLRLVREEGPTDEPFKYPASKMYYYLEIMNGDKVAVTCELGAAQFQKLKRLGVNVVKEIKFR